MNCIIFARIWPFGFCPLETAVKQLVCHWKAFGFVSNVFKKNRGGMIIWKAIHTVRSCKYVNSRHGQCALNVTSFDNMPSSMFRVARIYRESTRLNVMVIAERALRMLSACLIASGQPRHSHEWAAEALTSVGSRGTHISGQPRAHLFFK